VYSEREWKLMRGFPRLFIEHLGFSDCENPEVQLVTVKDKRGASNQYGC
jgi:hypothetical protein